MYPQDLALNNLQWWICHKTQPNHIYLIDMYIEDSALNNLQGVICHKTQLNKIHLFSLILTKFDTKHYFISMYRLFSSKYRACSLFRQTLLLYNRPGRWVQQSTIGSMNPQGRERSGDVSCNLYGKITIQEVINAWKERRLMHASWLIGLSRDSHTVWDLVIFSKSLFQDTERHRWVSDA